MFSIAAEENRRPYSRGELVLMAKLSADLHRPKGTCYTGFLSVVQER